VWPATRARRRAPLRAPGSGGGSRARRPACRRTASRQGRGRRRRAGR
jgi:hypothetical protein